MSSKEAETERQSPPKWSRAYAPAALVSAAALAMFLAIVLVAALFTAAISRADGPPDLGSAFHPAFQAGAGAAGAGQGLLGAQAGAHAHHCGHAAAHGGAAHRPAGHAHGKSLPHRV